MAWVALVLLTGRVAPMPVAGYRGSNAEGGHYRGVVRRRRCRRRWVIGHRRQRTRRDDFNGWEVVGVYEVEASPQRVFEAITDPEQVAEWRGPEGFTCPEVTLDPRVGGVYRIAMQPPEGELFHLAGEYVEVEPASGLAYTFRWEPPDPDDRETVARLVLRERDGGRAHPVPVRNRGAMRAA
jgi:uncharacterized protein YndB with AHSA1/START domain